jgi:nitrite reductase (NADH) small subunit/3-phenylpropionate/trans-cinnamate dioxygenase ferredoxin subunit
MATRHTVAKVGDLAEGESTETMIDGRPIALFLSGGRYYAIENRCAHAGAPLAGGYVEGTTVTCPWHAWRFRLDDGAWADNPRIKIGCYTVHVDGDDIQIELPA